MSFTASAGGSGTLFVSSGGTPVAPIHMIGTYTPANFSARDDGNGHLEIFDPTVPNGGRVAPGPAQSFPQQGIDLPNIAFGEAVTRRQSRSSATTWRRASSLRPTATAARWSRKHRRPGSTVAYAAAARVM